MKSNWKSRFIIYLNPNTDFTNVNYYTGLYSPDFSPIMSYNSNYGFGVGDVTNTGNSSFYYPSKGKKVNSIEATSELKNTESKKNKWTPFSINHLVLQIETPWEWDGAFTPGLCVIYPRGGSNNQFLSNHEPGHVLQFHILGPLYYPLIAIPSLITSNFCGIQHNYLPYEKSANQLWFWWSGEYYDKNEGLYYFPPNKKLK